MDPIRERFEAYIQDTMNNFNKDSCTPEDLLVYTMILQEYTKHCNPGINYEAALHKYNEVLFKILGRGEKNGF